MKNKFTKKANEITIDIADATWIANRLSDFASWIGVTPYKAKKLAMMARKIHKKIVREVILSLEEEEEKKLKAQSR